MKKVNKLSLRLAMLMMAIMGTVNVTLADDITVGDVSNSDCRQMTRAEGVAGHTILKLTRSETGLVGELRNYGINCGYGDVKVLCEEDGDDLTIVIDDDAGEHSADCTCPINIYFTLFNVMQDEFHLKVRGRSERNVGTISFKEHSMVEIDLSTLVILYDESFEYHLKAQGFWVLPIPDNVDPVIQKLSIGHESETAFGCAYENYVLPLDYSYLDVKATLDGDSTLVINVQTDGIPDKNGKQIGKLYFNIVNTFRDAYHLQVNHTILFGSENEQTTCVYEGDITVPISEGVTIPLAPTSTSLYIEPLWYYVDLYTKTACVQPSETCKSWSNIVIPPSVEVWGINCTVDKIEDSTFSNLSNIESVTIPEGLTSIGWRAFYGCRNLMEIDIPSSVTSIGDDAFAFCEKLEDVYCRATTPPYTNNSRQFRRANPEAVLHVPAASLQVYKETAPWSDFKNIVPLETPMAYRPFVEDGKVWKVGSTTVISDSIVKMVEYYYFDGDTIIDGKTFKQMMCQRYVNPNHPDYTVIVKYPLLRKVGAWYEEDKKVYFYDTTNKQFKLMYDFSIEDNGTFQTNNLSYVIGPKQTGGIKGFKGVHRGVREYGDGEDTFRCAPWLEGVGGVYGPPTTNVFNVELADPMWFLMSCTVGDEVIYFNDGYEDGATPEEVNARKQRIDFTHTIKIRPKARKEEAEPSLYGEYNALQLGINLNPLDDAYEVRVTDETGKTVYEKTVNAANIVGLNIDISAYAEGRYTVTVENNDESFTGEIDTRATGIREDVKIEEFKNGSIYNLQGQRISTLRKGLNIVSGRKVYVK